MSDQRPLLDLWAREQFRREAERLEAEALVLLRMGFEPSELCILVDNRRWMHGECSSHIVPKMALEPR